MRQYGGNKINNSYSVENNNNNNNCNNSNNTTTENNWRKVMREHIQGQYFCRRKKNDLQVNLGIISKVCFVRCNEGPWIKYFQKGYVPKIIPPEIQGPTTVNILKDAFYLYWKGKR